MHICITRPQWVKQSIFHTEGWVQDCSNSIANALELLQSCSKPLIYVMQQSYRPLYIHCYGYHEFIIRCMHTISSKPLTHWAWVTHMCNLTIIGSDNGLSPGRRQVIIWTNAGILLIGPLGKNLIEMLIEIHTFSFMKMHLKVSSAKWQLFCLSLNVLTHLGLALLFWSTSVATR